MRISLSETLKPTLWKNCKLFYVIQYYNEVFINDEDN